MSANSERSMNAELLEGTCDGTYKRKVMDRSNYPDPDRAIQRDVRDQLSEIWYGIAESQRKITPEGRVIQGRT